MLLFLILVIKLSLPVTLAERVPDSKPSNKPAKVGASFILNMDSIWSLDFLKEPPTP